MTNTQAAGTNLVVVDGSNIATEGRSIPSLAQLNDAVISLTEEFPGITVTVVVDATFGHRIDKSEVPEFDEAVAHNELVSPPAGAIGRGDAFVLSIANKVGARIFSNDSFQEFHGVYSWLFDEGRLIGGKPVPNVGWVFVNRVPVKGAVSRKARGAGRDASSVRRPASSMASLPMPIPTSPPPRSTAKFVVETRPSVSDAAPSQGRGRRRKVDGVVAGAEPVPAIGRDATAPPSTNTVPPSGGPVNDLLPFLDFIQNHPVGSSVTGSVESYSSHGAYVTIGDLRGYVPLRLMGNPPPRSAREVMRSGDEVALVVASFAPARRSVDLAVPGVAEVAPSEPAPPTRASGRRRARVSPAETSEAELAATRTDIDDPEGARPRRRRAATEGDVTATSLPTSRGRGRKAAASEPVAVPAAAVEAETVAEPAVPRRTRARTKAAVVTDDAASTTATSSPPAATAEPEKPRRRAKQTTSGSAAATASSARAAPAETAAVLAKKLAAPTTKSAAKKSAAPTTKSAAQKSSAPKSAARKSGAPKSAAKRNASGTAGSKAAATRAVATAAASTPPEASHPEASPTVTPAPRRRRAQSTPRAGTEST